MGEAYSSCHPRQFTGLRRTLSYSSKRFDGLFCHFSRKALFTEPVFKAF